MKNINLILHRISILFYIFVGLYVLLFIYGNAIGIFYAFGSNRTPNLQPISLTSIVLRLLWIATILTSMVWYIVVFIKLLITIGGSIKRKNIFNLRTVKLIKHNAIINGIMLFLLLIPEIFFKTSISKESLSIFADIIIGCLEIVMMLIFAQVLRIGYILKQEQELTI